MTSIIAFKIDNGHKMMVVGDTQHTYSGSTFEETKILPLKDKKLIFCGAGKDRIIQHFHNKLFSQDILEDCKEELLKLKSDTLMDNNYDLIDLQRQITPQDIFDTEFFIIDVQNKEGKKICQDLDTPLNNIDIIGSGSEYIGYVQSDLQSLYSKEFNEETKQEFFEKILRSFSTLGKHDAFTGHPAIFRLQIYFLEDGISSREFFLKFKEDVDDVNKYEVIEND